MTSCMIYHVQLTLDARNNGPLLDGRRFLKTIGVDSSQKRLTQAHDIETVRDLVPVTL